MCTFGGVRNIYNTRFWVENEEVRWVVNSETISNVAIAVEDRQHHDTILNYKYLLDYSNHSGGNHGCILS